MTIKGKIKIIKRVSVEAPSDGVHVMGKDGTIKGTQAVYINGVLVPHG